MKSEAKTRVVHCKREPYDVYIGRPGPWGNPFMVGDDGSRRQVIEKYEEWVRSKPEMMQMIPHLKGKVLGCWCYPKSCHGDVLVQLVEEL